LKDKNRNYLSWVVEHNGRLAYIKSPYDFTNMMDKTDNNPTIDMTDNNTTITERSKPLQNFYLQVSGLAFRNPAQGRQLIKEFTKERHLYTGPVNIWFNLSAETGRLQLHSERQLIVQAGLQEHPGAIDLLCEVLQGSYGLEVDPELAQTTWSRLSSLEESKFYWRYWVYGAVYHGTLLRNQTAALELLDKGLHFVSSDCINDIVRAYRRILIDVPPTSKSGINSLEERKAFEIESFGRLEKIYKWAIDLGVENSYDIALELARLYQEHATMPNLSTDQQTGYLERALDYLELAERRYTANPNHTIWEVYLLRARIFMGLRKCSDAFQLFSVIPEKIREEDPSIEVQFRYAAKMAGEVIPETVSGDSPALSVKEQVERDAQSFFQQLFSLAASNDQIKSILMSATNQLMNDN
jgi:hypothetical protein